MLPYDKKDVIHIATLKHHLRSREKNPETERMERNLGTGAEGKREKSKNREDGGELRRWSRTC